jgi:hypothetical protein
MCTFLTYETEKGIIFYDTVSEINWLFFLLIFLINEHDNIFSGQGIK